jgi:signal transduction histidine kinase/ActR/RegA family two-component response regulator
VSVPFLRTLPIRHKLVAMLMITSGTVLLLSGIGYLVNDYFRTRDDVRRDLQTQGRLILENSIAALDYKDTESALDTLRTLAGARHFRLACLYTGEGRLFVDFGPVATGAPCPTAAPEDGYHFSLNRLEVIVSMWRDGRAAGRVYLRSDLGMIWGRLRTQIMVVVLLLVFTLAVALLISARLQSLVSGPVMTLAATAGQVSSRGDYSLRAERTTDDELGILVEAFNRMLDRIQLREEELSKANDELRHEIVERKRAEQERAHLLVREREANRLKDEFLATLSHELRTPLNAILGWTRLLRANAVPPPGVDRALEKVERNAQIQSRLVEDLLEVSRIASGKLHLVINEVDLVSIVNRAVDSIRPAAEARGVSIQRRFSAPSLSTAGDGDRLQQVVWNLLSNAVKFTPAGGTVTISLERDMLFDELKVTDTGMGIDPSFLPHVFDTFRQADASSTRAYGGLGLGLSIVRHLVEMHGGAVEAASGGLNEGATFTVRLPVRSIEPQLVDVHEPRSVSARALAGATILVVDDDPDTRELLESVFAAAGAEVHSAGSAPDALAAAIAITPDALISDIAMPGQDGYGLLRQLNDALGPRSPRAAVALTAFAGEADRERAAAAGFHRHVAKPFDPVSLVTIVEDLLGGEALHVPEANSWR